MRRIDPRKILGRVRAIGQLGRTRWLAVERKTHVTEPTEILEQARKIRALARLFESAGDHSLAADTFGAAAELYRAGGKEMEACDCDSSFESNVVVAMDRILRVAAEDETAPLREDATVEIEIEVADGL